MQAYNLAGIGGLIQNDLLTGDREPGGCKTGAIEHDVDYILTEHARSALKKRQIEIAWVEQALVAPEQIEADPVDSDLEHRLAHILAFGDRVLRVVVNIKKTPAHVVTVFFDRRRSIP